MIHCFKLANPKAFVNKDDYTGGMVQLFGLENYSWSYPTSS